MQSIKKQFKKHFDRFNMLFYKLIGAKDTHKYTLLADHLYTRQLIETNNSRININRQDPNLSSLVQIISEDVYLLLLYEDNLAHLFHDIFFPLYVIWRDDKKKILVSINENQFIKDFLVAVFGQEYLIFSKKDISYKLNRLIVGPEGRDLKVYTNYIEICEEIKNNCFNFLSIQEVRDKNLIYGRNELKRKNLLAIEIDFLDAHKIEMVTLSNLSFKEVVSVLAQA